MTETSNFRLKLKKSKFIWYSVQYLRLLKRLFLRYFKKINLYLFHRDEIVLIKKMYKEVRALFPPDLPLKNIGGFPYYYNGKNVLGYTGMSFMEKNGVSVGMSEGVIKSGDFSLSIVQTKMDLEINFPALMDKYKPRYLGDFGAFHGGTAVYFYQLMSKYCEPKILSIDITDTAFNDYKGFHDNFRTKEKVKFILNKSSLDCVEDVRDFLRDRQAGENVLLSYDDDHKYEHTYKELVLYAPLLHKGDVILMQDTWNQGLFGHETSPMLAVYRFLTENKNFVPDLAFNKQMVLPCNYVFGVIVKQ